MLRESLTSLFVIMMLGGCASQVGNDGASVGGSCVVSAECTTDSRCVTGPAWPAGYCATACDSTDDCLAGSVCVEADGVGGICVVSCGSAAECRTDDGYDCVTFPARGAAGTVMGCGTP